MTTPLPPHSGALPGGRGVTPTVTTTVASGTPASHVGMGARGATATAPDPSGRRIQTVNGTIVQAPAKTVGPTPGFQPEVPLPAQGSVAQGRARSSLDSHAIIPGVVADRPLPEQDPLGTRFYG